MTTRSGLFPRQHGSIPAAYAIVSPPALPQTYETLDARVGVGTWFRVLKIAPDMHGSSGNRYGTWPVQGGDARILVERLADACGYRWNY